MHFILPFLALVLSACSTVRHSQDGAPPVVLNPDDISDAVPRFEVIAKAGNRSPYEVNGQTYYVLPTPVGYKAEGLASWYGTKFHGRKTSNGETFNMYEMSAAHKTLPIPCYAKVTNLENGRSGIVRINDRGPFHSDRIIDLSYAAASKLGYMAQGTAKVLIEVIDPASLNESPLQKGYFLQLGAFSERARAEKVLADISAKVGKVGFIEQQSQVFRAKIGPISDFVTTDKLIQAIVAAGFSAPILIRP
jgi:rare lipoprotein A